MSTSLDYFNKGIARAIERRAKEIAQQQSMQVAEQIDGDAITSVKTGDAFGTNTTELTDKQYQTIIVQKMTALIHKRKMK